MIDHRVIWHPDACDVCGRKFDRFIGAPRICYVCLVEVAEVTDDEEPGTCMRVDSEEHASLKEGAEKFDRLHARIERQLDEFERGHRTLMELYNGVKHAMEDL